MNSRPTSKIKKQFLPLIIALVLAMLSWRFFPTPGIFLGNLLLHPLLRGESFLHGVLTKEPTDLSVEEEAELAALRAENERLRLFSDDDTDDIMAGVIGRPTALPYDVLLIDKGTADGIKEGTPVYAASDAALGFVSAVYEHSALVALVSTPGYVSTVYIYGPNIYTTAIGQGGGVTRIHVPQGVVLSVGNPVVMPSLARGIYGSITAVDSVPERPEQYGYMTSDIPVSSLRFVAVGKEPISTIDFEAAKAVVDNVRRDFLLVDVPVEELTDLEGDAATTTESVATSTAEVTATTTTED